MEDEDLPDQNSAKLTTEEVQHRVNDWMSRLNMRASPAG
ncbi:hypothetical protein LP7551_00365 [Roseibium album]|nr:hypothetical protein LP7551_00365 [Roseibium album]